MSASITVLFFFELGGKFYPKGLSAHAPSTYMYDLGGKWNSFTATVGLQDGAFDTARARFRVIGDGKSLFKSRNLRVGNSQSISVDVSGVKELELKVESTGANKNGCWSIWVEPRVVSTEGATGDTESEE